MAGGGMWREFDSGSRLGVFAQDFAQTWITVVWVFQIWLRLGVSFTRNSPFVGERT
jgi:hypothetical protein